jgi:hypothetical protein
VRPGFTSSRRRASAAYALVSSGSGGLGPTYDIFSDITLKS